MKIAVISDLHDNTTNWDIIARWLADHSVSVLINCGDTCAPAMLKEMSNTFKGQIYTVFGNVADRRLESTVVKDLPNVTHYGDAGTVVVAGKKIFFNHFPEVAEREARSGLVDVACHGHTHLKRWEKINKTFVLNPGTAAGMFQYPSFAVLDLENMSHQFIEVNI